MEGNVGPDVCVPWQFVNVNKLIMLEMLIFHCVKVKCDFVFENACSKMDLNLLFYYFLTISTQLNILELVIPI